MPQLSKYKLYAVNGISKFYLVVLGTNNNYLHFYLIEKEILINIFILF